MIFLFISKKKKRINPSFQSFERETLILSVEYSIIDFYVLNFLFYIKEMILLRTQ